MRILLTSDWHGDAKTLGRPRFADVDRAVFQTVEAAERHAVDAYVFLGDLCDPDAGSAVFRCVELAVSVASALSKMSVPNYWIAGNHDVIEDGSGDTTLSPLRPLADPDAWTQVFERPGRKLWSGKRAKKAPRETEEVMFHFLPYTATSHPYRPANEVELGKPGAPRERAKHVVVAHLAVEGVQPGEETTDMPRGRDVVFPRELFPETLADVHLFNGHYHRQQTHSRPGFLPVHIPGSPARFTFGESGHEPGYLIAEV